MAPPTATETTVDEPIIKMKASTAAAAAAAAPEADAEEEMETQLANLSRGPNPLRGTEVISHSLHFTSLQTHQIHHIHHPVQSRI